MSGTVVFEDAKLQAVELIAETVTLNNFSVSTATTFQQTTNASNVTTNTLRFTNPATAFVTTGNVEVGTANLFVDTTTGNVGIGTSGPNRQLQIYGDSSNYFGFSPTEADDTSVDDKTNFGATSMRKQMMMRLKGRTWYWGLVNDASNNLGLGADGGGGDDPDIHCVFQNNGTFWTKNIHTSGNVGIGTTSPLQPLHVKGNGQNPVIYMTDPTNNRYASGMGTHNVTNVGQRLDFYNGDSGANGTSLSSSHIRMSINASGDVGIGTTSPDTTLHLYDTSTEPTIAFQHLTSNENDSSTNVLGNLCLHRSHRSGVGNQVGIRSIRRGGTWDDQADMEFYVRNGGYGSQTAMVINSGSSSNSAKVGIGKTDPSAALDVNGVISASGSTSGSAHSSSCILYLLDTPQIDEWSWTGATNNTLRITYSNIPDGCKAVLADVFMPQASNDDHVGHFLGQNVTQRTTWTSGRNVRPSTAFGNLAHKVIYLNFPGQSDNFEYYFGNWWPSQIIPLDSGNKMYHTVSGESTGTSSWMYIITKGYYL